jgi:uncharacterized protein (TIGR03382 family)
MTNLFKFFATAAIGAMALFVSQVAFAQAECGGGACGTPYESGGGGGCGCGGGSILINNTDMGDTYQYADDFDIDGWEDDFDNCPFAVNPEQADSDGDAFGDACDNCPSHSNPEQFDADGDLLGNSCDNDADNDGVQNVGDTCWLVPNPGQGMDPALDDADSDGIGNVCDDDDDNDGLSDLTDPCPLLPGVTDPCPLLPNVTDPSDNRCDNDSDDDGIPDSLDNCAFFASDDNSDFDMDGMGDACDVDMDNDGVPNITDNCRTTANSNQLNADRDGFGDACDSTFCFVIDSPEDGQCLNPTSRFQARPGPSVTITTGEELRLRIFTNRPNAPTQYAWKVVSSPAGADFEVNNPAGTVNYSTPWEFHYQKDRGALFVAKVPGEYEVELQSALVFDDDLYPGLTSDKQKMKITVEGAALGCASIGAGSSASLLVLAGLALLGWRRRR